MLPNHSNRHNPQSAAERFSFILSKLNGVTVSDNLAKAKCPAHDDKKPSLTVTLKSDGKINVKCFAEDCDYKEILAAIGLEPSFLYPPERQKTSRSDSNVIPLKPRIEKVYTYHYGNGHPAHETVRLFPKAFRFRKNKAQAKWSLKGVKLVPYNLPKVNRAIKAKQTVIFVEGEKDCDNGNELGIICTTVAGGSGKWRDEYEEYFKDADIVCIPDKDKAGIKGMIKVAKKLNRVAKRIRFLLLPVEYKGDLSDWIEEGGNKVQLLSLIALQGIFLDETLLIDKLNNKHSAIMLGGKFVVMNEIYDPSTKRKELTFSNKTNFKDKYENQTTETTKFKKNKKDVYVEKPQIKDKGSLWIKSPFRRQYEGLCFNPGEGKEIRECYNLWRGFAVKPIKGDCSLFEQHIYEVIAQKNKEIYTYILDWMADAVQNMSDKPGVTIIMRGGSRAGKGTVANLFGSLFGSHYRHILHRDQVVGKFNAHLSDCLILFADEAFYAGDKQHEATLKGLITEPTRMIEKKGKDAITLPNYTRIIAASNKDWVAPLEIDDGRFFIVDVANFKAGDHEYFNAIYDQMNNEKGKEALLYNLMHRDISQRNIKAYPQTQAILDNKLESMNSVGQWIFHILSNGDLETLERSKNITELYDEYKEFCGRERPAKKNAWSRQLKKFFPGLKTVQRHGESKRHYEFPALDICRKQFEDRLQSKIEWDEYEYEASSYSDAEPVDFEDPSPAF